MTDISVIILIGQEKIHLERCIKKLVPLGPRHVFLVGSQPDDGGVDLAKETARRAGWEIEGESGCSSACSILHYVFHQWPGLYAKQFNWALDNLPIDTKWVLRLDADEYLPQDTINRLKVVLERDAPGITGYALVFDRTFWGKPVHRGVGRVWLGHVFQNGIGRCEDKQMDEHIIVSKGRIVPLEGGLLIDDNLNGPEWWTQKHLGYAEREARDAIIGFKEGKKRFYYSLPPYWRALAYFLYRYILRGGFLEGRAGFKWHFFQGLWYRMLVDAKIEELTRENKN